MAVLAKAGSNLTDRQLLLSQLRVAVVITEALIAEAGDSSRTQRKGNVRLWKPPPNNG
jgi:hypothetical protein